MRNPKNRRKKPRIGVKYCGGCNPSYDRVATAERLMRQFEVAIDWCSYQAENLDLVLVISGCQTNCADTDFLSHASLIFLTGDSEYEVIAKRISSLVSIDDSPESLS